MDLLVVIIIGYGAAWACGYATCYLKDFLRK